MKQRERWSLTPEQHTELWQRWKAGESLSDIGRALGRVRSGIHHWLATRGGIAPAIRRRSVRTLSLTEREVISRGLAAGKSIRQIAQDMDRSPSTVSREVSRHGGRARYRACQADKCAWDSALRPKPCALGVNRRLRDIAVSY